jgi:hypothetical protein
MRQSQGNAGGNAAQKKALLFPEGLFPLGKSIIV